MVYCTIGKGWEGAKPGTVGINTGWITSRCSGHEPMLTPEVVSIREDQRLDSRERQKLSLGKYCFVPFNFQIPEMRAHIRVAFGSHEGGEGGGWGVVKAPGCPRHPPST